MTDNTKPTPGSDEYWEWVRKRAEARGKQLSGADTADFEESGLLVGGEEALRSTDAESFPDETEEYTPGERKPKLIKKSSAREENESRNPKKSPKLSKNS